MNAVNENIAAVLKRPIIAFPEQDHLAHIQVHLDFMASPMLGGSVLMAQKFIPVMLDHLSEHIGLWYATRIHEICLSALEGRSLAEFQKSEDAGVKKKFDQVLAAASQKVVAEVPQAFGKVPQVIQQAMQIMSQLAPPNAGDPSQASAAAAMAETQRKTAADKAGHELKVVDLKQRGADSAAKLGSREKADQERIAAQLQSTQLTSQTTKEVAALNSQTDQSIAELEAETKLRTNTDDNRTAMQISAAEVELGHKSALSTGGGIGEGK